jgi:hypothetical protein
VGIDGRRLLATALGLLMTGSLVGACSGDGRAGPTPPSHDPVVTGGAAANDSAAREEGPPVLSPGDIPQATNDYLACLREQGMEAEIGPFGDIGFEVPEDAGSVRIGADDDPAQAQAEAERLCAERVPDYEVPNLDTR